MVGSFQGSKIFFTITNITQNFNTRHGDGLIREIFDEDQDEAPYIAWESSCESNDHVHVFVSLEKTKKFSRRLFKDILEHLGTKALNIQTWSRSKTYQAMGKNHKNKFELWCFEKLIYCWITPEHECYFDAAKFKKKSATVLRFCNPGKTAQYTKWRNGFELWLNAAEEEKKEKPSVLMKRLICREGLTVERLEEMCVDEKLDVNLQYFVLENFDKFEKMILKRAAVLKKISFKKEYPSKRATYRPFQEGLAVILDSQNDRNIHLHTDEGCTGKNMLIDTEAMRPDTLILQNAKSSDIAAAYDPDVHKRIIFDVPKGGMQYLNTRVIEQLKNGCLFSSKYKSKMKKSLVKPSILILGNEDIQGKPWTDDRLTQSTTSKSGGYVLEDIADCSDLFEPIYQE